jgi:hypothetical protein
MDSTFLPELQSKQPIKNETNNSFWYAKAVGLAYFLHKTGQSMLFTNELLKIEDAADAKALIEEYDVKIVTVNDSCKKNTEYIIVDGKNIQVLNAEQLVAFEVGMNGYRAVSPPNILNKSIFECVTNVVGKINESTGGLYRKHRDAPYIECIKMYKF